MPFLEKENPIIPTGPSSVQLYRFGPTNDPETKALTQRKLIEKIVQEAKNFIDLTKLYHARADELKCQEFTILLQDELPVRNLSGVSDSFC
jgi:hypothetical protein